eukprot:CAMPEP_0194175700 /NCGR_PEP_ID=MMETSP0154-20130528/9699_1 /TAXON_ID=1049557 /ORGANISM="Thalassiothrix antarctica, Strain L6-D1" /LENGTH=997 /DNA_ID=CAMNT_0038889599 /DNA_START=61 /DNA_END=3055 /DNA_ORIENTATION=-
MLPKLSLLFLWVVIVVFTTSSGGIAVMASDEEEVEKETDMDDLMTRLISWLRDGGGKFHDSLQIRREDPSDPTSRYGMFATEDIAEDEILIRLQRHQLLTEGKFKGELEWFQDGTIWCPTAYNLIYQMRDLGPEKSKFGPYIEYLLTQEQGQLPSHWSSKGKRLLLEVLAQNNNYHHSHTNHLDDLRPSYPVEYVHEDWVVGCRGSATDRFEQHAALMLLQRGWDDIMIPVYDMMSHRNGEWLNTKSNSVHNVEEPVTVSALKNIKKGDEIYTTYNHCKDCGNRVESGYGTPELLRDFGFVENYPQRWNLGKNAKFDLDRNEESGNLEVTWLAKKKRPSNQMIQWMQIQLERLRYFPIDDDERFPSQRIVDDICRHDFDTVPSTQTASPGIVVILEAEDIQNEALLSDPSAMVDAIVHVLEEKVSWKRVASDIRTLSPEPKEEAILTLIFEQGYVQVRTFPSAKYCAIDLHVWGGFQTTQDEIQDIVLKTIQSTSYQSYRIVAGGIFGLDSWKDDAANLGPRLPEHCHNQQKQDEEKVDTEKTESEAAKEKENQKEVKTLDNYANSMLQETLETIVDTNKDAVITVLCGPVEEDCAYATLLKDTLGYTNVVPLYACPYVTNEYAKDAVQQMKDCETEVYQTLRDATSDETGTDLIRAIVLDRSTTYIFGRIVYKVLSTYKARWFREAQELLAFSIIDNSEDQDWRRNLMERFRMDVIVFEPNFATETIFDFGSNNGKLEMGMTSSGDFRYTQKYLRAVANLESQFGVKGDVRDLRGGLYLYYEDWKPDPYYLPQDYDQTSPYEQYKSQVPMGFQTLFQLGPKNDKTKLATLETEQMIQYLRQAWIESMNVEGEKLVFHSYPIGSGFVVSSTMITKSLDSTTIIGGSCMVVFDGNKLLNVNLFTYDENRDVHKDFAGAILSGMKMKQLEVKLRDMQPRGYGKVLSFRSDLDPYTNKELPTKDDRVLPHWVQFDNDSPFQTEIHTKSECSRDRGCTLFE